MIKRKSEEIESLKYKTRNGRFFLFIIFSYLFSKLDRLFDRMIGLFFSFLKKQIKKISILYFSSCVWLVCLLLYWWKRDWTKKIYRFIKMDCKIWRLKLKRTLSTFILFNSILSVIIVVIDHHCYQHHHHHHHNNRQQ